MAVAGSAVPAVRVEVRRGELQIGQSHHVQSEVTVGVDDAIDELIAGKSCYLKLYGENLAALKRRWANEITGEL